MNTLANNDIKRLMRLITVLWCITLLLAEGISWLRFRKFSWEMPLLFLGTLAGVWAVCLSYFRKERDVLDQADAQIRAYLAGDKNARIECEREGALYRLFHSVNSLAAVLNAHADNELRDKEFLKNTISDISHQLKTPLAALNIYNGLLQEEDIPADSVKEFAALSEQELDRIENLVQNLLKITKLDAGSIVIEKTRENIADMMQDVALHFAYRAKAEGKEILLQGADAVFLSCDRDWLLEAIDNLVKNAFDHTDKGGQIVIAWKAVSSAVRITVQDNGCGIHPEDLYHIFKRFYRSRFSKDTQGLGLGLPLAKAVVEAHGGTIEVDSELGHRSCFTMQFPIPTKL